MTTSNMVEILLVEDNPNDLELMLHAFQKGRFRNPIQVVRDGVEALEFMFCEGEYAGQRLDMSLRVVFLDIKLPRIDGFEVLRRLRTDPRTRLVPIVMLTSSREESDMIECYRLGVNSYIVKPVDFDQFTETIKHLGLYWLLLNETPHTLAAASEISNATTVTSSDC